MFNAESVMGMLRRGHKVLFPAGCCSISWAREISLQLFFSLHPPAQLYLHLPQASQITTALPQETGLQREGSGRLLQEHRGSTFNMCHLLSAYAPAAALLLLCVNAAAALFQCGCCSAAGLLLLGCSGEVGWCSERFSVHVRMREP